MCLFLVHAKGVKTWMGDERLSCIEVPSFVSILKSLMNVIDIAQISGRSDKVAYAYLMLSGTNRNQPS